MRHYIWPAHLRRLVKLVGDPLIHKRYRDERQIRTHVNKKGSGCAASGARTVALGADRVEQQAGGNDTDHQSNDVSDIFKIHHFLSAMEKTKYFLLLTLSARMENKERLPWASKVLHTIENIWDHRHIVIGLDVDSFACAALMQTIYPEARVVALYDAAQIIVLSSNITRQEIKSALWLDQDVLENVLCVGQHLITGDCVNDLSNRNVDSFNPNHYFEQRLEDSFRRCRYDFDFAKYPFSTLAMLLYVFDGRWTRNECIDAVIRHADSTGYNVRCYRKNCLNWADRMFPSPSTIANVFCETFALYSDRVETQCVCESCRRNPSCHCQACVELCREKKRRHGALQAHLALMLQMESLAPTHFDSMSRSNADYASSNAAKLKSKSDAMRQLLLAANFSSAHDEPLSKKAKQTCNRAFPASSWLQHFRGYQGLHLRRDAHDTEQFCKELTQVFALIARGAFSIADPQRFSYARCEVIARAQRHPIGPDAAGNTVVRGTSLEEFLQKQNVFSYAIIERNKLRITPVGGFLSEPIQQSL